jgi:hypothetical protein
MDKIVKSVIKKTGQHLMFLFISTVVVIGHAIACTVGLRADSIAFVDEMQAYCSFAVHL